MTAQYETILKSPSLRVLVYNGDTDMACNFLGDEWFVDDLKQPIKHPRTPWYVKGQVAGFVKAFDKITYTTIRVRLLYKLMRIFSNLTTCVLQGAGHMVPQWAPEYAYDMFEKFINNKPFKI